MTLKRKLQVIMMMKKKTHKPEIFTLICLDIWKIQYFTLILYNYFIEVNMKNKSKIKEFIQNGFGWIVEFENFDSYKGKLPYILLEAAEYSLIICDGYKGVAIQPKEEDDFRMTKNIALNIERITGLKSILILGCLDSYQRKSLTENHISFIIPGKQLYLPDLGAMMSERGMGLKSVVSDKLSAVATTVVLLHLSHKSLQNKNVTALADMMGYSVKTLSLAVKELEQHGLVSIRQEGRKKLLDFKLPSNKLWEKVKELSENPIEKRLFTSDVSLAKEIGMLASDSALAELSMLSSPNQPVYAVYCRNPRLKELKLNAHDGSAIVEIWKSDPSQTAKNGILDIFSLALSYKDDDDPRIRKELDKLINESL